MIYASDFRQHFRDAEEDGTFGIRGYLGSFVDMASEFLYSIERGNTNLPEMCGCLWIYTKYRLVIHKNEAFERPFHAETWISKTSRARMLQDMEIRRDGELYCEGRVESCLMHMDTRTLAPLSLAQLPTDIAEAKKTAVPAFVHPNYDRSVMREVYTYEVRYSDLDKSRHMFNLRYVPMFLDAYPPAFYEKWHIRDVEIHYMKQIYYGEKIKIFTDMEDGNVEFLAVKEDGTEAAWMCLGLTENK